MESVHSLVQQSTYPLIPTNLPGAFASPPLPENLDLSTASQETLVKHGILLHRPGPNSHPSLVESWEKFLAHRWRPADRILPVLEPQIGKTHVLRRQKAANSEVTNSNWAGGVLLGSWNYAQGRWHVPAVRKPLEGPGTEGGWNSSSWVGLDGSGTNDVLQAGIQQRVNAAGQASYVAWYEWYAPQQPNSPAYIFQTNITNFPVAPGDQVFCMVQYINNNTAGYLLFNNESNGKHFTITLAPPPGANFTGNCMEWIMEAPDGGVPTAALPAFTPVQFVNAMGGKNALSLVPITGHPQNGDTFDVVENGKALTASSLQPDGVQIQFIADTIQVRFRNATTQTVFFNLNGGAGLNTSLAAGAASGYNMVTDPGVTPAVAIRQTNGSVLSFSVANQGAYAFRLDGGEIKNFFDN